MESPSSARSAAKLQIAEPGTGTYRAGVARPGKAEPEPDTVRLNRRSTATRPTVRPRVLSPGRQKKQLWERIPDHYQRAQRGSPPCVILVGLAAIEPATD
jgi:hypothetical protein